MANEETRKLDARGLRGLAHPLRVRILSVLRTDGPATATGLAQLLGETSGTTSWHLRQLAGHGFVEEDTERGNKRERWWRARGRSTTLDTEDFWDDPELREVASGYLREVLDESYRRAATFLSEDWGTEWVGVSTAASNVTTRLTAAETGRLNDEILALARKYQALHDRQQPVPGAETVLVGWQIFPRRGPGSGS